MYMYIYISYIPYILETSPSWQQPLETTTPPKAHPTVSKVGGLVHRWWPPHDEETKTPKKLRLYIKRFKETL